MWDTDWSFKYAILYHAVPRHSFHAPSFPTSYPRITIYLTVSSPLIRLLQPIHSIKSSLTSPLLHCTVLSSTPLRNPTPCALPDKSIPFQLNLQHNTIQTIDPNRSIISESSLSSAVSDVKIVSDSFFYLISFFHSFHDFLFSTFSRVEKEKLCILDLPLSPDYFWCMARQIDRWARNDKNTTFPWRYFPITIPSKGHYDVDVDDEELEIGFLPITLCKKNNHRFGRNVTTLSLSFIPLEQCGWLDWWSVIQGKQIQWHSPPDLLVHAVYGISGVHPSLS